MSEWRVIDDGKGAAATRRPPRRLRDGSGFLAAADEIAWLRGERPTPEIESSQRVEGAVANSSGPGQERQIEEPQTDEW
ncbi:hypothetical protein GCM10009860_11500 [Microbacterium mitrae]